MATGFLDQGGKLGASTFSNLSGAASDLFTSFGDKSKAQGDFVEGQNYGLASDLATQNAKFTEVSTGIKQTQMDREASLLRGGQEADVASAGFTEGGSALDIMADSARQGAITHAVAGEQGLITEAGYNEQAASYKLMQGAANDAGNAANNASTFAEITGGIKALAGLATLA
jgi:hypothetical protein